MEEPANDAQPMRHPRPGLYAIGEVAEMTGISAFTLRYYDKCGFFPELFRGRNNVRSFSDHDIAWLRLIDALRKSGLSIEGIQYFVRISQQGDASLQEQYKIIEDQEKVLDYQIAEAEESLRVLQAEKLQRRTALADAATENGKDR